MMMIVVMMILMMVVVVVMMVIVMMMMMMVEIAFDIITVNPFQDDSRIKISDYQAKGSIRYVQMGDYHGEHSPLQRASLKDSRADNCC
jgi:hypothetical protein